MPLRLNRLSNEGRAVGIDIGGTRIKIGLLEGARLGSCRVLETRAVRGAADTLAEIARVVREMTVDAHPIEAVGVGAPGLVEDGTLVGGLNLPGWTDVPIRRILEDALRCPVRVVMDVEAVAAGEFYLGGHGARRKIFVFTLGTGVGAAAVLDGDLQAGAGGLMLYPVVSGDSTAAAFRTLEEEISAPAIVERALRAMPLAPESQLHEIKAVTDLTAELICEAAECGDALALDLWRRSGELLGWAAVNVAHLLLLDRVVIGGGMSRAGEVLLGPTRGFFYRYITPGLAGRCDLTVSALGDQAGMFGAALLAEEGDSR